MSNKMKQEPEVVVQLLLENVNIDNMRSVEINEFVDGIYRDMEELDALSFKEKYGLEGL